MWMYDIYKQAQCLRYIGRMLNKLVSKYNIENIVTVSVFKYFLFRVHFTSSY